MSKVICVYIGFALLRSAIAPRSHAFSRALRRLHVFAWNSDWFIALFASVVIGQSDTFGFGFKALD